MKEKVAGDKILSQLRPAEESFCGDETLVAF